MKKTEINLFSEVDGVVEGHRDGHGFLAREDGGPTVFLPPSEMAHVLHGDRVRVRITREDRKGRPEGRILDILERKRAVIIGRLLQESGSFLVAPEDKRFGQDILIPKAGTGIAQVGQVVCVELTEPPSLYSQPVGKVTEVLGDIDDPGMEIEIAVRKFSVPHQFSAEALAEAQALPSAVRAIDKRKRVDLTDVALVTIDGEDARDFDDAVYCESCEWEGQAGWRLVVAIADVSHYVKPDTALDQQAYERSTSVYFPRRVIPMLPEKLSNGLCSLNPEQDRLAMVCDMVVSTDGDVVAYQFYNATICSHARLTYSEVAAILGNTKGPEAKRRAGLVERIVSLHGVYRDLLRQRLRRGAVDFDTTETQIVCDESGHIEKIVARTRNDAHRLIEEAMLAANTCAADFIAQSKHPALFRVHEGPTPEKRLQLQNYLKALGLGMHVSDNPQPGEFQAIASATKDRPDAAQIHQNLLRSMQQAIYTPQNSGHFGLAYEAYTHFTSPIRRYPDLLVHRVLKALLSGKPYQLKPPPVAMAPEPRRRRVSKDADALPKPPKPATRVKGLEAWELAGEQTSGCERRADEASRDVEAWLKCRFMRDRLGNEYAGTVTSVAPFGIFVTLDELFVEGLVHVTELGGDYFKHDEIRQELRGERTGRSYVVGTRLRVQVSRVDLDGRRIDFRLVQERGLPLAPRAGVAPAPEGRRVSARQRLEDVQREDWAVKKAKRSLKGKSSQTPKVVGGSGQAKKASKGGKSGRK